MKDQIEKIIVDINDAMVCEVSDDHQLEIDECMRKILNKHLLEKTT